MSDDIRAGDVVVCVSVDGTSRRLPPLVLNRTYRVVEAAEGFDGKGRSALALVTTEIVGSGYGYNADRFRKLPAADAEFTAQMRALKPRQKSKQEA